MPFSKVAEGVFQVGGEGLSSPGDCCVYLLDAGGGGSVLVDAGLAENPDVLFANIEETGHHVDDIAALILTHCHIDHIGGANAVVERSRCDVVAHEEAIEALREGLEERTAADAYGVSSPKVTVTHAVEGDGAVLEFGKAHFIVVHTPGHTPDNITLIVKTGGKVLVFANDVHGPFSDRWGSDMAAWRRSMDRLIAIDPDVLLEGQYGIIRPKGRAISFIREWLTRAPGTV